jgi:hypothetical protein
MKVKTYMSAELALKPEDCKILRNEGLRLMLYRLDVEFAKKDFDESFDVYYEALWR